MSKNCPNCGAVYTLEDVKCPYCNTLYFDKYKIIYAIPATSEPEIIDKDVTDEELQYIWNDFEVIYDYQTKTYSVNFETMLGFSEENGARNWIAHCLDKMTDYMVTHNLSVAKELNLYEVFTQGINVNTEFDTLEDLYAFLKFTIFGFTGQGLEMVKALQ